MKTTFSLFALSLLAILFQFETKAQTPDAAFFDRVDGFMLEYVQNGRVPYALLQNNDSFDGLIKEVGDMSLEGQDANTIQAFYINAYNLLVLKGASAAYPLESVLDINGFFETKKYLVAGEKMTLNQLEKGQLLKVYKDPRYHFVLVCGAVGCPPIVPFAYRPEKLDQQLEIQTKKALNNPNFIQVNDEEKSVKLSQIFEWYTSDFGGSKKAALEYINKYRRKAIPSNYNVGFYTYDWKLNGQAKAENTIPSLQEGIANNSIRYVVSSTIKKGTTETKIFNNLYSQIHDNSDGGTNRSTFFTTFVTSLYGVSDRFNAGVEVRYRSVLNSSGSSSPFSVFGGGDMAAFRHGVTSIGPKIRWAPVPKWGNFSIQSALWIPVGSELEGNGERPYIDWNNPTSWTQIFNDFTLGTNFSLFTELQLLWEDIGGAEDAFNRFSTPATLIFSYFPNPKTTVYALSGYSPSWTPEFDYFYQAGAGAKYQFTRNFELEFLYTYFNNQFLAENNGRASTINFGIRINR